jgi:hypothetical protein
METLINKILSNNHYILDEVINGYSHENKSYFFIRTIGGDELEEIKSKALLDEQTWYGAFVSEFKENTDKPNYFSLEKNSSLIVLVEASSINDIERLQSQILLIEEDQFFVKKYVIIYTRTALSKISNFTTNLQFLNAVNNRGAFQSILANGFNTDQEDFILLLQLFIKLPFLTLQFNEDDFISLHEKLINVLENDYSIFRQLIADQEQLLDIDFLSIDSENEIDNLLTLLTYDSN